MPFRHHAMPSTETREATRVTATRSRRSWGGGASSKSRLTRPVSPVIRSVCPGIMIRSVSRSAGRHWHRFPCQWASIPCSSRWGYITCQASSTCPYHHHHYPLAGNITPCYRVICVNTHDKLRGHALDSLHFTACLWYAFFHSSFHAVHASDPFT